MNIKIPICLFLFLTLQCGCNKVSYNELESVVQDNLILFPGNKIPDELDHLVETSQILFLGETHYVQEHHDYISLIFDRYGAEGFCFFNEFSNAYNWMIEDYIAGEIEHLPYLIRLLNHTWVETIREINLSQNLETPVRFFFMDVNQWEDDFKNSIRESEKVLGDQNLFALIKMLDADHNAYLRELEDLKEILEMEAEFYINLWGEKWHLRYTNLVNLEIESYRYRTSKDDRIRGEVMLGIIQSALEHNPGVKAIINCGMNHAQKEPRMGTHINPIRAMLEVNYSGKITSIAFSGISGKRKFKFNDSETIEFDILETAVKNDLMRIIGQKAGVNMALLILDDPLFSEEMDVTYTAGAIRVAPGKQFDAIITYPEITILKSLSDFSY